MKITKWRFAAVGAMAALSSVLALSAMPANASITRAQSEAAAKCSTAPIAFGLHGMGEGPSSTVKTVSPILTSFSSDLNHDSVGRLKQLTPVPYPTVDPGQWRSLLSTFTVLDIGEVDLQADIAAYVSRTCAPDRKIALVGYSMGAWVINKWLMDHRSEWSVIKDVELYGDPCYTGYTDGGTGDRGLVRLFGDSHGCTPAGIYPYPSYPPYPPFHMSDFNLNRDPVSGYGWDGARLINRAKQLWAAIHCETKACAHMDYPGTQLVDDGAEAVAGELPY